MDRHDTSPMQKPIGIIGVGAIGSCVASHLLKANKPVGLFDIDERKVAIFESPPATIFRNLKEVACSCNVVILSLPTPEIISEVVLGDSGLISSTTGRLTIIDLSTNSVDNAKKIGEECRRTGNSYLDSPITGGIWGAQRGDLTVMVGGDEDDYKRVLPILRYFGRVIIYVGPHGYGAATKLIHNMLGEIQVHSIAEAFCLAAVLNLNIDKTFSVISHGMASSKILTELYGNGVLTGDFTPNATVDSAEKDQRLLRDIANGAGFKLTFTPIITERIRQLREKGFGSMDVTSVLLLFEETYGVVARFSSYYEKKNKRTT